MNISFKFLIIKLPSSMIKNKPLTLANKIAAYILSILCICAGSFGLFLSFYNYESIIVPLAALAFIIIGILYGIAAFKGKPLFKSKSKN